MFICNGGKEIQSETYSRNNIMLMHHFISGSFEAKLNYLFSVRYFFYGKSVNFSITELQRVSKGLREYIQIENEIEKMLFEIEDVEYLMLM